MDILNFSFEERERLLDDHPIVQKNYIVITPTIKRVYAISVLPKVITALFLIFP